MNHDAIKRPEEDWPVQVEVKDIITLLQQSALDRLGTGSALEVKEHYYAAGIDWGNQLCMKTDFPLLDYEDDTSFSDTWIFDRLLE